MSFTILIPEHFSIFNSILVTHSVYVPYSIIDDSLTLRVKGRTKTIDYKYGSGSGHFREDSAGPELKTQLNDLSIIKNLSPLNMRLTGNIRWFSPCNGNDTQYNMWILEVSK